MLEVKGELVFKTVAYHRAADAIAPRADGRRGGLPCRRSAEDRGRRRGHQPTSSPSSPTTGHLRFYERLRREVPPALVELLRVPGLGPQDGQAAVRDARASRTSTDLRHGRRGGQPAQRPRPRPRRPRPRSWRASWPLESQAAADAAGHRGGPASRRSSASWPTRPACITSFRPGSFRRRRETIGDIDLLAETDDPDGLIERFVDARDGGSGPQPGRAQGRRARCCRGPQVDLMVMPPGQAGAYLVHFTGRRSTTSGCAAAPATAAGACPRRATSGWRPRASRCRGPAGGPADVPDRGRRSTASSTCRSSSPSCARTAARSRRPIAGTLPHLVDAGRPARRPATATPSGPTAIYPIEQMAEAAPSARLLLPGADRPLDQPRASPAD